MGLPWSAENLLGWRTRYDAVRRWAHRCRECYEGDRCVNQDDFVDFFLAFMVMSYSLRDFAIHTGGISQDEMDQLIHGCEAMRLCRDICNRGKHYAISKPSIDPMWSLGRERNLSTSRGIRHFLIAGDEKHDPLSLVDECLRFWDGLISEEKLVEPPNPFSRE